MITPASAPWPGRAGQHGVSSGRRAVHVNQNAPKCFGMDVLLKVFQWRHPGWRRKRYPQSLHPHRHRYRDRHRYPHPHRHRYPHPHRHRYRNRHRHRYRPRIRYPIAMTITMAMRNRRKNVCSVVSADWVFGARLPWPGRLQYGARVSRLRTRGRSDGWGVCGKAGGRLDAGNSGKVVGDGSSPVGGRDARPPSKAFRRCHETPALPAKRSVDVKRPPPSQWTLFNCTCQIDWRDFPEFLVAAPCPAAGLAP